ncbi:unnamed protein product [marine sediment metagenome]|uniref:Uncharacterized protein n=1 Tax=marine sediment metagenome TaxID=412755 RepID=X1IZ54_9ZZZZ
MTRTQQLEEILARVHDQKSFIQNLLIDGLGWEISEDVGRIEDICYEWTTEEIHAEGLTKKIIDGKVLQLKPIVTGQPWGIFILEFKNPDVFVKGRGMTGILRKVLRGLVQKRTRASHLPAWKSEDILFFCTHSWQYYSFVHFAPSENGSKAAKLTSFGWTPDSSNRTLLEHNLPHLGMILIDFRDWD